MVMVPIFTRHASSLRYLIIVLDQEILCEKLWEKLKKRRVTLEDQPGSQLQDSSFALSWKVQVTFYTSVLDFLGSWWIKHEQSYLVMLFTLRWFLTSGIRADHVWIIENVLVLVYIVLYMFSNLTILGFSITKFENNFLDCSCCWF